MGLTEDEIGSLCQLVEAQYKKYGKRGKPTDNEWTHLSAIVSKDVLTGKLEVLSLATGTKCLGASFVDKRGYSVNDSHAEVLARRGFISYLYTEMSKIAVEGNHRSSVLLFNKDSCKKFILDPKIELCMYCSHTPCGDASIIPGSSAVEADYPAAKKLKSDKDIFRTGAKCTVSGPKDPLNRNDDYHAIGAFRTKPGRGERTLSMSCSDKICKWAQMGIQGALLMNFLEAPIYLTSIVFARCPYSKDSVSRAIISRNQNFFPLLGIETVYSLHEPKFYQSLSLSPTFYPEENKKPSSLALLWHSAMKKPPEVLVDGFLQGTTSKKLETVGARSIVSRWRLIKDYCNLMDLLHPEAKLHCSYLCEKRSVSGYNNVLTKLRNHYKHWICDTRKIESQECLLLN